jgi:hypothetical protein
MSDKPEPPRKSKAQLLREEYERKLSELQASCPHAELSDWIESVNDPEDIDARRRCLECAKVIHAMRTCRRCGRTLTDDEARFGDGRSLAWSSVYCVECFATARAERRYGP